jgi:hypothetical protein
MEELHAEGLATGVPQRHLDFRAAWISKRSAPAAIPPRKAIAPPLASSSAALGGVWHCW